MDALSESEIDRCLLTLYECGGDPLDARDRLFGQLGDRTPTTVVLQRWRVGRYRDRYQELAEQHGTLIEDVITTRLREIATVASTAQLEALHSIRKRIRNGDTNPQMITQLAIVTGVSVDKLMKITERDLPNINLNITVGESIERLSKLGIVQAGPIHPVIDAPLPPPALPRGFSTPGSMDRESVGGDPGDSIEPPGTVATS